jgi:hypothetical protein
MQRGRAQRGQRGVKGEREWMRAARAVNQAQPSVETMRDTMAEASLRTAFLQLSFRGRLDCRCRRKVQAGDLGVEDAQWRLVDLGQPEQEVRLALSLGSAALLWRLRRRTRGKRRRLWRCCSSSQGGVVTDELRPHVGPYERGPHDHVRPQSLCSCRAAPAGCHGQPPSAMTADTPLGMSGPARRS